MYVTLVSSCVKIRLRESLLGFWFDLYKNTHNGKTVPFCMFFSFLADFEEIRYWVSALQVAVQTQFWSDCFNISISLHKAKIDFHVETIQRNKFKIISDSEI
jgi:hypothetical protein